jgi:preprotein translocase subunit SecD
VTLSIGIVASLFTAIFVSRVVFDFFLARVQVKRLSI